MPNRYLEEADEVLIRMALRSFAKSCDAAQFKSLAARARALAIELAKSAGIKVIAS